MSRNTNKVKQTYFPDIFRKIWSIIERAKGNVLSVLNVLDVLNVLSVLNVLNVL